MTTVEQAHDDHPAEPAHDDHAHDDHPTEKKYWIIALILAVITAVEVALSYIDLGDAVARCC